MLEYAPAGLEARATWSWETQGAFVDRKPPETMLYSEEDGEAAAADAIEVVVPKIERDLPAFPDPPPVWSSEAGVSATLPSGAGMREIDHERCAHSSL